MTGPLADARVSSTGSPRSPAASSVPCLPRHSFRDAPSWRVCIPPTVGAHTECAVVGRRSTHCATRMPSCRAEDTGVPRDFCNAADVAPRVCSGRPRTLSNVVNDGENIVVLLVMATGVSLVPGDAALPVLLRIVPGTPTAWPVVLGCAVVPAVAGQAIKSLRRS